MKKKLVYRLSNIFKISHTITAKKSYMEKKGRGGKGRKEIKLSGIPMTNLLPYLNPVYKTQ
jgi:hypothetical protein